MTLSLSARPTIVAREERGGWNWLIEQADVETLRLAQADGLVGTAQRRENGGVFVLLAWAVPAQRQAAVDAQAERKRRIKEQLYLAPAGCTPRIYRRPTKPKAMRTYGGYEACHWVSNA